MKKKIYRLELVEDYIRDIEYYENPFTTSAEHTGSIYIPEFFGTDEEDLIEFLIAMADYNEPLMSPDPLFFTGIGSDESIALDVVMSRSFYNRVANLKNADVLLYDSVYRDENNDVLGMSIEIDENADHDYYKVVTQRSRVELKYRSFQNELYKALDTKAEIETGEFEKGLQLVESCNLESGLQNCTTIPTKEYIKQLWVGATVALAVEVSKRGHEILWVDIKSIDGDEFVGIVDETPENIKGVQCRDVVKFNGKHIVDYIPF